MSSGYSRTFIHLFAQVSTHPTNLADTTKGFMMSEIIPEMLEVHNATPLTLNTQAGGMRLMDYRLEKDHAVLLVACADRSIPDPTMLNIDTAHTRPVGALAGYLWAYSAHLFIGFKSTTSGDHPIVLEGMPKLPRTVIEEFLNRCFSRDKYTRESDGRPVWPGLKLRGDVSSQLKEALQKGKLTGVDLLKMKPRGDRGVGDTGMDITRETLSFRPPRDKDMRRAFSAQDKPSLFKRLLKWGHEHGYDRMRVCLDRVSDVPSSMEFSTEDPDRDSDELFFIRRSTRNFATKLNAAHQQCVPEVLKTGYALLLEQYARKRRSAS